MTKVYTVTPAYFNKGDLVYANGKDLSSFLNYTSYPCTIKTSDKDEEDHW